VLLSVAWLANAFTTFQLADDYGIGVATVHRIKERFLKGMLKRFGSTLDFTSPDWVGRNIRHQPPFSRPTNLLFSKVIGAGDGVHIKLKTNKTSARWISGRKGNNH
jgi:hypothetical protein